MAKPTKEAITYSRVSSVTQEEKNLSIPAQEKLCKRFAQKHGYRIVESFTDGRTARKEPHKRTGFLDLLSYARKNPGVTIIVDKRDRFSRDATLTAVCVYLLRQTGSEVESVTDRADTSKPGGRLTIGILDQVAQFFSDNLSHEVKKGQREALKQGSYPGGRAPYGYDVIRTTDGKRILQPNPDRAKIVRQIYEWYIKGSGSPAIAARLNEKQIEAPRGQLWGKTQIENMIKNVVYRGDTLWGGEDKKLYPGTHERIVSESMWDRMERKRVANAGGHCKGGRPAHADTENILKGVLHCYRGHRYYWHSQKGGRYLYYRCGEKSNRASAACDAPSVPALLTNETVLTAIRDRALVPENLEALRAQSLADLANRDDEKILARLRKRIATVERQRERIADAIIEGVAVSAVKAKDRKLALELDSLRERVRDITCSVTSTAEVARQWSTVEGLAASFRKNWLSMPLDLKRRAVALFVRRVTVLKSGKLKIVFGIPGGGDLPPVTPKGQGGKRAKKAYVKQESCPWTTFQFDIQKNPINPKHDLAGFAATVPKPRT